MLNVGILPRIPLFITLIFVSSLTELNCQSSPHSSINARRGHKTTQLASVDNTTPSVV